jgi:YfiH family protein
MIVPEWPAPPPVRAIMTLRSTRDDELAALLPREPAWLRQVHGTSVLDLDSSDAREGDAALTRRRHTVIAIKVADCMPVLLADEEGTVVAGAHAGWRGLSGGVIEATIEKMRVPAERLIAWMGPAIGASVYEVGDEVRAAFREKEAFSPTRPGHWLLDLYSVARRRLAEQGVERIFGGGFCTYSDPERFYSYRRDRVTGRMAAMVWLT